MQGSVENRQILLVRLGGFGDVVFTLPAVHLVRSAFPDARITFLVYREYESLLQGFPGVDATLTLDRDRFRKKNPITICTETIALLRDLARNRFSLAIDFHGFGETGLITWLSRAPQRWGAVYRPGRRWHYTRPIPRNPILHPIESHLDLLRQAGGLELQQIHNEFVTPQKTLEEARHFFRQNSLDPDRPTLFIQPFTSTPHKNWPLENFISVARYWRERGLQVLFGGGPAERGALEPVRQAGFVAAAGSNLLSSAGLVKLSNVVLGGDTGLLHLAVAMNKWVVMLMGSVAPGTCFPFGHQEWAVHPPNGLPLDAVRPDAVNEACAHAVKAQDLRR